MSTRRQWPRRLVRIGAWLCGAGLLLSALMLALVWHWVAKPPAPPPEAATLPPLEARGDRVYVGRSWFGYREGMPVLYLTGTPYEMGYANGALTQKFIHRQEDAIVTLLNRVAPNRWIQSLLKFVVVYKNRNLPKHILPEYQLEILGMSLGCPDQHAELGPYYHRLLNYHAAQDISYMLMNSPLLRGGCTAFATWGTNSSCGHLLTGRNFDWEADPVFDEDRLVVICEPKDGVPFISVAWAGMVGCVSGMNREGISVTVNGAPSKLPNDIATPTCLVAREILQNAHNLAEAIDIVRRRQVFVSALFMVGSRRDERFVVVEKTPSHTAVREAGSASYLICANHYLTPDLESDPINQQFKRADTSVCRYDRVEELLLAATNEVTPVQCAAWLRDRRLPAGQFAGNGHRSALNPLIATHAVVMDLSSGILWAARPPHQLGAFVAFDVTNPAETLPDRAIPEDPMLASGEYQQYLQSQAKLDEGWQALKQHDYHRAEACAQAAERNNPGFYRNSWLLAEALKGQGQSQAAARACHLALAGQPALGGERRKIESLARQLEATLAQAAPAAN